MEKKKRVIKRKHQWFIEPEPGTETNEKLAAYLSQESISAGVPGKIIYEGQPVKGWIVERRIVNDLKKAAKEFHLKFRVFVREGEGEWRLSFLDTPRPITVRSKEGQRLRQEIIARKKM